MVLERIVYFNSFGIFYRILEFLEMEGVVCFMFSSFLFFVFSLFSDFLEYFFLCKIVFEFNLKLCYKFKKFLEWRKNLLF